MQVKLTLERGGSIYVNMDQVISYVEIGGTTYIKTIKGQEIRVREAAEDIYKQVTQNG